MEISEDTDLSENVILDDRSESSSKGTVSPVCGRLNQSFELEDYTDVRYDLYAMAVS